MAGARSHSHTLCDRIINDSISENEVQAIRRLIRRYVVDVFSARGRLRAKRQLLTSLSKVATERNAAQVACMVNVMQAAGLVAAHSILADSPHGRSGVVRKQLFSGSPLGARLTLAAARTELVRAKRTLRKASLLDGKWGGAFSNLCKQETLKNLHVKLASAKCMNSVQARRHHNFKARLADVRAELYGDLCIAPSLGEKDCPIFNTTGWRGINLSGWLLWEPGPADESALVASLGDVAVPSDEWSLCQRLIDQYGRAKAEELVHTHRNSHVTKDDFVRIKKLGFNAVRVPFGYWAFRPSADEPYVGDVTPFLDAALDWGAEVGLAVVLCLHAAVGFQSNDPPCGRANENWSPRHFDVHATVDVMRQVAERYGQHGSLGGVCILNEPGGDLPASKLNKYFKQAYAVMRNECRLPVTVQIMMPVFHHDFEDFRNTYTARKGYHNVVFDVHCYQVFGDPYAGWCRMSLAQHLRFATASSNKHDARYIADRGGRVVVTEFSVALPPTWDKSTLLGKEHTELSGFERTLLRRSFAFRQLRTFMQYTEGFFFWSWKDDSGPEWSYSDGRAIGWMPTFRSGCEESNAGSPSQYTCNNPKQDFADTSATSWKRPRVQSRLSDASTDVGHSSDEELTDNSAFPPKRPRVSSWLSDASTDVGHSCGVCTDEASELDSPEPT